MAMIRKFYIVYAVICLIFLSASYLVRIDTLWKFYPFDRSKIFIHVFFLSLLVLGFAFNIFSRLVAINIIKRGLLCGFASGVVAQFIVILVNKDSLGSIDAESSLEILYSILIGSVIFLTPFWGAFFAWLSRYVVNKIDAQGGPINFSQAPAANGKEESGT